MKKVIVGLLALGCGLASADSIRIDYENGRHPLLPSYVFECKKAAEAKLLSQAKSYGVTIDLTTLRLSGASTNPLASYLWWTVDVTDGRDDMKTITKITQKPLAGKCF